jgi:hypothetical protein
VEHLGLFHLMRARAAQTAGDHAAAARAIDEGLHTARQAGLGLYQIELLCEQAELLLADTDAGAAKDVARGALQFACARRCRFFWGAAAAAHLLGVSLARQGRDEESRAVLAEERALRGAAGSPDRGARELCWQACRARAAAAPRED